METFLLIIAFIVACVLGIAWDYYKPARFRTTYRNVDKKGSGDSGSSSFDSDFDGDGGGD